MAEGTERDLNATETLVKEALERAAGSAGLRAVVAPEEVSMPNKAPGLFQKGLEVRTELEPGLSEMFADVVAGPNSVVLAPKSFEARAAFPPLEDTGRGYALTSDRGVAIFYAADLRPLEEAARQAFTAIAARFAAHVAGQEG